MRNSPRGVDRGVDGFVRNLQTADQEEHLYLPSQEFERWQQITNMGNSHTIELAQKFNTVGTEKFWITGQDDIADVARLDPFRYDRGDVTYVIVMA